MEKSSAENGGHPKFLQRLSYILKALWIFFPGILFVLVGWFIFVDLSQGKDIIYQSTDNDWVTGIFMIIACIFWIFTTWYTSRIIAYNRYDIYVKARWVLYHFPRLISYAIFFVLWIAAYYIDTSEKKAFLVLLFGLADYGLYYIMHRLLNKYTDPPSKNENIKKELKKFILIRWFVRAMILILCTVIVINWTNNNVIILCYTLPFLQQGFLFLVIMRFPIEEARLNEKKKGRPAIKTETVETYQGNKKWSPIFLSFGKAFPGFNLTVEKPMFRIFNCYAVVALIAYILSVNSLMVGRSLTSFPLVMLCFGILLGIINIIALVSRRYEVNINFLIMAAIVIAGFFHETHPVRLKEKRNDPAGYSGRPNFRKYLQDWISTRKEAIKASNEYPVFFTLADGGASRSGYWVALVLSKFHRETLYDARLNRSYFRDHLFGLSGASGGSVGNAVFAAGLKIQQGHSGKSIDSLCIQYLDNDFLVYPLIRLFGTDLIKPLLPQGIEDRAGALEIGMENPGGKNDLMAEMIRGDIGELVPDTVNKLPLLCINTTRVQDGSPGVVSTIRIDSTISGKRLDVLDMVAPDRGLRLSTAMVLGARFPYMSPGGSLKDSYFVDGGYLDNSGAGIVHEMLLQLSKIARDTTDPLYPYVRKLRFYVIHLANSPYSDLNLKKIHPLKNDAFTPILTLAGSYSSQTSINDARLINYLKELNDKSDSYIVFNLYDRNKMESLPMNWVISNRSRAVMFKRQYEKPDLDKLIRRLNDRRDTNLFEGLGVEN